MFVRRSYRMGGCMTGRMWGSCWGGSHGAVGGVIEEGVQGWGYYSIGRVAWHHGSMVGSIESPVHHCEWLSQACVCRSLSFLFSFHGPPPLAILPLLVSRLAV